MDKDFLDQSLDQNLNNDDTFYKYFDYDTKNPNLIITLWHT